jgi:hypothetical protein
VREDEDNEGEDIADNCSKASTKVHILTQHTLR